MAHVVSATEIFRISCTALQNSHAGNDAVVAMTTGRHSRRFLSSSESCTVCYRDPL